MKTFGKAQLVKGMWHIECQPHVMIMMKRMFPRISPADIFTMRLKNTPEMARDIDWFMARYPLEISKSDRKSLKSGVDIYVRTQEQLEAILLPDYKQRDYVLMVKPPRDYQATAAEMLLTSGALLCGDELGLGKTVTAFAALNQKTLPVCNTHITSQWKRKVEEFLPSLKPHVIHKTEVYDIPDADVFIISYHKLASWARVLAGFIRYFIIDEIQEFRHQGTTKYAAGKSIRTRADYCMGLSATPIYNYGSEIYPVLDMVQPDCLGTWDEFLREWCTTDGRHYLLRNAKAMGEYLRMNHLMVRRTRKEVGRELPGLTIRVEKVGYDAKIIKQMDNTAMELAYALLKEKDFHKKGELSRQLDNAMRQFTGLAKAPFVAAFVRVLVEAGEKVLLFGWHRSVYDVWAKELHGIRYVWYTGEESTAVKDRSFTQFTKGDAQVMIMSLRSGAGLDGLQTACSVVVFGELDWAPGVHDQAVGRLHRDDLINPAMAFYMVCDEGSDPGMIEVLGVKNAQCQGIINPRGALMKKADDGGARMMKMARDYLEKKGKLCELN